MKKLFSNILVPVDVNSRHVALIIEEALELARQFDCNIHLLYIRTENGTQEAEAVRQKMLTIHSQYAGLVQPPFRLHTTIEKGKPEQVITTYSGKHHIDLVLLGRSRRSFAKKWLVDFNINRLSKKLKCPVLSLQSKVNFQSLRNIVMPVGTFLPVRKLMFATYLAKKYNSRLHLVAISDSHRPVDKDDNVYLLKAYHLIKDNTEVPVECKILSGEHIANTTLEYAKSVKADLIVVNPGQESMLSGFINRIFSRLIPTASHIPVMTVASALRNE